MLCIRSTNLGTLQVAHVRMVEMGCCGHSYRLGHLDVLREKTTEEGELVMATHFSAQRFLLYPVQLSLHLPIGFMTECQAMTRTTSSNSLISIAPDVHSKRSNMLRLS